MNGLNADRVVSERPAPTKTDWLARAKSLLPLIEAEAQRCDELRTLSPPLVNAFKETELFWMLCPTEVGGGGCGMRDLIEVIAELAWADCSASWSLTANAEATAAEAAVTAGEPVSDYQRARFRQVATWVHKVAADVVRFAYLWSGSEGFRGSTAIGRMFRDTFVATQHIYVDTITLVDSAPGILKHYRCTDLAPNKGG